VSIEGDIATIEVAGVRREASLSLVDNATVGDYVIVHAGYAIHKIDETTAMESLKTLNEVFASQQAAGIPEHSEDK